MINLEKARGLIIKNAGACGRERRHILFSQGYVLGEDVRSDIDMPPFEKSAMDGYAIRLADLKQGNKFKIIEKIPAGRVPKKRLRQGECFYITTGAMLPKSADTVVRVEDTRLLADGRVEISANLKPGENICKRGEDIQRRQVVLKKGKLLLAQDLGILASVGREFVNVFSKPKVCLITTGGELVKINKKPAAGQIRDSNTYSLAAQVMDLGILPQLLGIIKDNKALLRKAFKAALEKSQVIIISGGVSKGEYDFNKEVLRSLGVKFIVEKISMRPGMPTSVGVYQRGKVRVLVFGLAGNPVSTFTTFDLLVRPAIKRMMGIANCIARYKQAILTRDLHKKPGRTHFLPGYLEFKNKKYWISPLRFHGSADLLALSNANAFIVVPKQASIVKKASWVDVLGIGG